MEQPTRPKVDTTEKVPRKKPERRPLGDEMLVMGRCLRELQTLDSGAARARVAQYLLSRTTDPPEPKNLPGVNTAQEGGTPEVGPTLLD